MSATRPPSRASETGHRKRLRREVFPPRATAGTAAVLVVGSALATFAVVVTAIGLAASASSAGQHAAPAVVHIIHTGDARPGASLPAVGEPSAAVAAEELPPGAEASLVTELDGRAFMVLGSAPDELLEADSFRLLGGVEQPEGAIATVGADAVGAELAAWSDREVRVGSECLARVEGFAVLSPMIGSVDYMPLETWEPAEADVIRALLDVGENVLAAQLDDCAGLATGAEAPLMARDVELPPLMKADVVERRSLEKAARAHLLASESSKLAQRDYAGVREDAGPWWELPFAEIEAETLRHPHTRELLVSVTASAEEGCGHANVNLWGLYRVDEAGELEAVSESELEPGLRLHHAADVNGDGELTWIASRMFGGSALVDASGEFRAEFDMPFFGCPC